MSSPIKVLSITRTEIARELGISISYVCRLLKGKAKNPKRIQQIEDLVRQKIKAA